MNDNNTINSSGILDYIRREKKERYSISKDHALVIQEKVRELNEIFASIYGSLWGKQSGVANFNNVLFTVLCELSVEQISKGVLMLDEHYPDFPPNLLQFKHLCLLEEVENSGLERLA